MAEQIELVGHVQEGIEQPGRLRLAPGKLQDFIEGRIAPVSGARFNLGLRVEAGPGTFINRPGCRQVCLRRFNILIRLESLLDQAVHDRVIV